MNKAFTRESSHEEDDEPDITPPLPAGQKNYITPGGYARLKGELDRLVDKERPETVSIVSWAAGNGDRSENGDYLYGKKRLREIDRRIRFLVRRLDIAEVVDPAGREDTDQIFFGASVDISNTRGEERRISVVGIDETDTTRGYISWISPMARALLKARAGDTVTLHTPVGAEDIEVLDVRYVPLATGEPELNVELASNSKPESTDEATGNSELETTAEVDGRRALKSTSEVTANGEPKSTGKVKASNRRAATRAPSAG